MKKLRLTPAASVSSNENGILLRSDLGDFQLHGRDIDDFIQRVMPLLEGQHDQKEICTSLPQYGDSSIIQVLDMLLKYGLLEECESNAEFTPPWQMQTRFLTPWRNQIAQNQTSDFNDNNQLASKKVLVIGLDPWSGSMVNELATSGVGQIHILDKEVVTEDDVVCNRFLGQQSIGQSRIQALQQALAEINPWCNVSGSELKVDKQDIVAPSKQWDLVVVTLGPDAQYWLHKTSEWLHKHKIKAIYGYLEGLESWIGPVVNHHPEQSSSCWNCMRLRKLGTNTNAELAHLLENATHSNENATRARSMLTPMAGMVGQQLAMEVVKLLWNYTDSRLLSEVYVQNLITQEGEHHGIIPVPWCDVCGFDHDSASCHPHSVVTNENQDNPLNQLQDKEQLEKLFKGWVDTKTGIIRQLTGHASHLPDFPVTASAGVSTFTVGEFDPRAMGQIGSGKGLDDMSANISAIGEALERYSASRYQMADCKYASISQLRGDYIDPETLVLYSKRQYATPGFPFHKWLRKQKIHWSEGHWLGTDSKVWVPSLVTYFNFACPHKEQFSQVSSNGLAAGQNNEDAAIRACYELIERDAMMLTWYAQLPCKRLSYKALYNGKMRVMIDDLTSLGMTLELYTLDSGVHVPTVVCLALGDGFRTPAASVALATHGDIKVAMRKALLEQGHVMPYLCQLMSSHQKIPRDVSEVQGLEDHAAYYFSKDKLPAFDFMRQPESEMIEVKDWPYPVVKNSADLRNRLLEAGVEVAVVDVTSPDIALSPFRVARAVGVHMQPIHFGEQFKRVDNPRLRKLLQGRPVNNEPHPIA